MTARRAAPHPPPEASPGPAPARAAAGRPRVRRGNVEDALKLKAELRAAAMELFSEGGLAAVSMRAVGEKVGVSMMTPYHYFEDKAALLASLWEDVLEQVHGAITARLTRVSGGQARYRALVEAFLAYWETHPDEFRLVYLTQRADHRSERPGAEQAPVYGRLLALVAETLTAYAAELGVAPTHIKIAADVSLAFQLGYLHAALVNRRYPWSKPGVLRAACIGQVIESVERCLRAGADLPARRSAAAGSAVPHRASRRPAGR